MEHVIRVMFESNPDWVTVFFFKLGMPIHFVVRFEFSVSIHFDFRFEYVVNVEFDVRFDLHFPFRCPKEVVQGWAKTFSRRQCRYGGRHECVQRDTWSNVDFANA